LRLSIIFFIHSELLLSYAEKGEDWKERGELAKNRLKAKREEALLSATRLYERCSAVKSKCLPPGDLDGDKRPAGEAADGQSTKKRKIGPSDLESDPRSVVGQRMGREFQDGKFYFGTVKEYVPCSKSDEDLDLWEIVYDDGEYVYLKDRHLLFPTWCHFCSQITHHFSLFHFIHLSVAKIWTLRNSKKRWRIMKSKRPTTKRPTTKTHCNAISWSEEHRGGELWFGCMGAEKLLLRPPARTTKKYSFQ